MININELLEQYRDLTIYGIKEVENYEEILKVIEKRQEIIKAIEDSNLDRNTIADVIKKLNLLELDNKFQDSIKKEMVLTKKSIANLKKLRVARKSFMKKYEGTPTFFDTTS